jgi:carbamoyl-phosphate synthase large subunit
MKSTGEVMAIDYDRFGAYFKSQIASGSPLPKSGNVFLSVRDEDKPQVAELAAQLKTLGFGIYATLGTSTYLWSHDIDSKAAFRISRGRPNALDLIRKGEINWVVNTSESDGEATGDSVQLRSCAVSAGIPVTTTLAGFAAAVAGLAEERCESAVYSLQEYHR